MFFMHLMSRDDANGRGKKEKKWDKKRKLYFTIDVIFKVKLLFHSIIAYLKFLFEMIKNARLIMNISIKEFHESMQISTRQAD